MAVLLAGAVLSRAHRLCRNVENRPRSTKNRSRAVLGAQGRFGEASGRAWDGLWTPKCHLKADLGAPQASQERPGAVQKGPQAARETLQDPSGEPSERLWCTERRRTRLRIDFWSLLACRAKAPMCSTYQFLLCFVGFERSWHETHRRAENKRKSSCFGLQNRVRDRPGDPKSDPGAAQEAPKPAKSDNKRGKKRQECPRSAQERKIVPTWPQESTNIEELG